MVQYPLIIYGIAFVMFMSYLVTDHTSYCFRLYYIIISFNLIIFNIALIFIAPIIPLVALLMIRKYDLTSSIKHIDLWHCSDQMTQSSSISKTYIYYAIMSLCKGEQRKKYVMTGCLGTHCIIAATTALLPGVLRGGI